MWGCNSQTVLLQSKPTFIVSLPHLEELNQGFILPHLGSKTRSSSCLQAVCVCVRVHLTNMLQLVFVHTSTCAELQYINNETLQYGLFYHTCSQLTVSVAQIH